MPGAASRSRPLLPAPTSGPQAAEAESPSVCPRLEVMACRPLSDTLSQELSAGWAPGWAAASGCPGLPRPPRGTSARGGPAFPAHCAHSGASASPLGLSTGRGPPGPGLGLSDRWLGSCKMLTSCPPPPEREPSPGGRPLHPGLRPSARRKSKTNVAVHVGQQPGSLRRLLRRTHVLALAESAHSFLRLPHSVFPALWPLPLTGRHLPLHQAPLGSARTTSHLKTHLSPPRTAPLPQRGATFAGCAISTGASFQPLRGDKRKERRSGLQLRGWPGPASALAQPGDRRYGCGAGPSPVGPSGGVQRPAALANTLTLTQTRERLPPSQDRPAELLWIPDPRGLQRKKWSRF